MFLRPGRLPVGGHYRLLGSLRDRLRRRIRMWVGGWNGGGLDDTPSSDDVVPPLAQIHLLGRGTGPLGFRSGRMACGDALSAALGRLLCNSRLHFLPLYRATEVCCVVSPATTALRLFPRGRTATGKVGSSTSGYAPWCVSAVTLRVAEALAALTLQRAFWSHVRLHRYSQAAEFGE